MNSFWERTSKNREEEDEEGSFFGSDVSYGSIIGQNHHNQTQETHLHKDARPGQKYSFGYIRLHIFLFLTEPSSSFLAKCFFAFLIMVILSMNVLMMMQTMTVFQFIPDDCRVCGGTISYMFDDDRNEIIASNTVKNVACTCPPSPYLWTEQALHTLIVICTIEWVLRVLTFTPYSSTSTATTITDYIREYYHFMTSGSTILDALSIFPYYMESFSNSNGLLSLRLLRLTRVFQIVRLGQYNGIFQSLTRVMKESMNYLKLLVVVLIFGAALCGSLVYWFEKGEWEYWEGTESYQFVRMNHHKQMKEISPFTSIPASFWWFFVTATTVGYGDVVPVTVGGQWIGVIAMLMGVLVIAFPVSVFSDLWHKELQISGAIGDVDNNDDGRESDMDVEVMKGDEKKSNNERIITREEDHHPITLTRVEYDQLQEELRKLQECQVRIQEILLQRKIEG